MADKGPLIDNQIQSEERLRRTLNVLQRDFTSLQEMLDFALEESIQLTRSKIGYIYHYSEDKREFVLSSWSKNVMPECSVINPESCYELDKTGIWGEAVRQRKTIILNDFQAPNILKKGVPSGHVELKRFLTVPILLTGKIVGVVGVANKETDYSEIDALQLQLLMQAIWERVSQFQQLEKLKQIEWMLSHETGIQKNLFLDDLDMSYAKRKKGLILSCVGREILNGLLGDYLDLVETSSVIFEKDGDYSVCVMASQWCKYLFKASLALCSSDNVETAIKSGKWLCHESNWRHCCKIVVEEKKTVEMTCIGGMHLFAVPIFAREKVVGAMNFAYGAPPKDQATLKRISEKFAVPFSELEKQSRQYPDRPPYIIEMAKKRIKTAAQLIGLIVESRQTESQLLHAMKMEAIGRLAGGVAHDFNNMLGVIIGHAEMALLEDETPKIVRDDIENIVSAARRSADLTQRLLAFARKQAHSPRQIGLNETVGNLQSMLKRLIGENIQLSFNPCKIEPCIVMDPSQLDQILANLVLNAKDAIKNSGKIQIETDITETEEMVTNPGQTISAGQYAVLSVSDNGSGMSQTIQLQIFEPFFTTKPEGKGTGLGLSTVYGIVEQNRGGLSVFSEEGIGTTFRIYLPLLQEKNGHDVNLIEATDVKLGHGKVLLVEDEKALIRLVKSMLEKLGYQVHAFSSPIDALAAVKNNACEFDLVLSDVVMPDMNGPELIEKILAIKPECRVMFMSGYAADAISQHLKMARSIPLIEKPFDLSTLSKKIRAVMDKKI